MFCFPTEFFALTKFNRQQLLWKTIVRQACYMSCLCHWSLLEKVCTFGVLAFVRTSASSTMSCHLIIRSLHRRQVMWKWLSCLACLLYTTNVLQAHGRVVRTMARQTFSLVLRLISLRSQTVSFCFFCFVCFCLFVVSLRLHLLWQSFCLPGHQC